LGKVWRVPFKSRIGIKKQATPVVFKKLTVYAHAKINLNLKITGKKDNLHTIETLVESVDLADVLYIDFRTDNKVSVEYSGFQLDGGDSVLKAVEALKTLTGRDFGLDIKVIKNIPIAGGLGGSGVDAAAVIRAADFVYDFGPDVMRAAALKVGSDVLYQLYGGRALVTGTGDAVLPLDDFKERYLVLIKCKNGVSAKDAYAKLSTLCPECREIACPQNMLTCAATKIEPLIRVAIYDLKDLGATDISMSGSGSTVFGFFNSQAEAQKAADELKWTGSWIATTKTVKEGIRIEDRGQ
jgi:4-diphosphocytidyl-2-C-methyl-D-erythritol kinase